MNATALVKCPECGKTLKVKQETLDGRRGRCPDCRHAFVLRSAVVSPKAAPSSRQPKAPTSRRAGASSGSQAKASSSRKSASRRTVKNDDYDDYGFDDDQSDYQPALPRGKRTAKASKAGARRKPANSGGGKPLVVVILLAAFLGLGAAGGGLYWWLQGSSETVAAVDGADVTVGGNVDTVADTSSTAPEQQQAPQASTPAQPQGQQDAEVPAGGTVAANVPEPNVPVASDRFAIPPPPTFSGDESMAEAAVSNAARDIQNRIEASIRKNMAGFGSPQDAGEPGKPSQRRTGDGVFVYSVPDGISSRSTLSTSGAYGKMDVEVAEVLTNRGVIFRVTQAQYPTSAKRKLKNVEKVLQDAAESILSQRQNSSVKSSRLITDFACPGIEYEFQADSMIGFNSRPNRVAMRVYLLDVSMYLFQVEVPGDLDYSQVDGVVQDFLNSIALSNGNLPASTALAMAGREPDAEEVQAIANMEKIHDAILKVRSQIIADTVMAASKFLQNGRKGPQPELPLPSKLLSWRVHILPLIGEEALYRKFHLDEPWDSSHNRKLLDSMPQVYECPGVAAQVGMTVYQKPDGPGTVWGREKAGTFSTETGTDRIFLLEVDPDHAIEWTRPNDFSIEEINVGSPLVGIGHVRSGGFLVNDGYFLSSDVDLKLFRDLCVHGTRVRLP